jgi:type IV secretory pathway protease TraF
LCERIPPGSVYLLGDNAGSSLDSRTFGPVPAGEVVGRVVLMLPAAR